MSEEDVPIKSAEELAEKIAPFIFDANPDDGCVCAEAILVLADYLSEDPNMAIRESILRLKQIYCGRADLFNESSLNNKEDVIQFWKKLIKSIKEEEKRET